MTKSNVPAESGVEAAKVPQRALALTGALPPGEEKLWVVVHHGLSRFRDRGALPPGVEKLSVELRKRLWLAAMEESSERELGVGLDKFTRYFEFARQRVRVLDESFVREPFEFRTTAPTAKPVGDDALRARITELEQMLAEKESINRTQHSRLVEERRAASTANRINDQLQMRLDELPERLDRQFDLINERARANDVALSALAAKDQGRLLTFEVLQGIVAEVADAEVVVRFDTVDDVVEQTYDLDQFKLGKAPAIGDQISVYVHVALVPPSADPADENKGETHEPRPRRNVITGDHRF